MTEERIRQRAEELRREFTTGRQRLAELEAEGVRLREALLRIDGAAQVLEELLKAEESEQP